MERVRTGVRTLFRRSVVKDAPAPKADELLNRCIETIQKMSALYSSWSAEDDQTQNYLMNRHQCNFLVGKLSTEIRGSLQKVQSSPLLDEKTIPVLEELQQVLLDVEKVIHTSRITSSQWPRAAIEQSEMKETNARLLYEVQWHASVLLSILVDNSRESSITFEPSSCEGELRMEDELSLLTAMKEDEESLKDRLGSIELDGRTEKRLAGAFLKLKMRSEEDDHLSTSHQLPESSGAVKDSSESSLVADDSSGFLLVPSSPDLLYLDPEELELKGTFLGRGSFAKVQETKLMGGRYALKILRTHGTTKAFDQEMDALQRLGHHPHIVRLLGYSKEDTKGYLVMEKMDTDLETALSEITSDRKKRKLASTRPFSDVQAVAMMLQIGEGVKYIHSKRMAHRDLKSGNILVNLADPSSERFASVKIADFGLTKTKNASQTHSNLTNNEGTTWWMAPEVMKGDDQRTKSRFNPRKADVYSFAIVCVEILTGKGPYDDELSVRLKKQQVKAGTLRPKLPEECPPKLAALIERCWHPISHERPLFPEICKELRYIKGLLLRGDQGMLEVQDTLPLRSLEMAQIQGPWGGDGGGNFYDVGTSINRMKLRYDQSPGKIASMLVDYNVAGSKLNSVRTYANDNLTWGNRHAEIEFLPFEFITHISGYVSKTYGMGTLGYIDSVNSLTIHTNMKSYGPYGDEEGKPFASDIGRVIGFHGRSGALLDRLGVVVILGDTS